MTYYSHLLTHSSGFAYDQANPALVEWSEYIGRKDNMFSGNLVSQYLPIEAIMLIVSVERIHRPALISTRSRLEVRPWLGLGRTDGKSEAITMRKDR